MVEAAARYNKIVQVGTMNRSRPAVQRRDQVHPGRRHRQGLHGARPVLQAAARHRQVSRRPDGGRARQYKLNVDVDARRAGLRRGRTSPRSTTTCGSARRRSGRSTATASTTTGTGTGTTATATPATRARTSSTSRAGASASRSTRSRSARSAATSARESSQETPDMQTALFEYADGTILEFAHARRAHQRRRRRQRSATCSTARRAGSGSTTTGRNWQSYLRPRKNEKGPGSDSAAGRDGSDPRRA